MVKGGVGCMKIGILGAGLAGLTVGNNINCSFEILEKNVEIGGLCRSLVEDGWTFDIGGSHIIFSRDKTLLKYMLSFLGPNIIKNKRNTKILINNKLIKYPLENGLSELSKKDNFDCLYYYLIERLKEARGESKEPTNFKEWIYNNFGKGIAELYLIPYNEKVWQCKSESMGLDWAKGRVPQPPLEDVIKSSLGLETEGYIHQLFFYYPKTGGIQSLIQQLERKIKNNVKKSVDISKIYKENDKWIVKYNDKTVQYNKLVSTIPIMELAKLLPDIPKNVFDSINALRYTSLIVVMLGFDSPLNNNISWLYVPNYSDGRFSRVSFPSNFSPCVTPDGYSSILAEITCREGDAIWSRTDTSLVKESIIYLRKMGLIANQQLKFSKVSRSRYAYVVYDVNYDKNVSIIYDYFSRIGIELCGRFAEFKYFNMDATMDSAIHTAKRLIGE